VDTKAILIEVLKYVNVKDLVLEALVEKIIYVKIDELVAKTDNTLDDGLAAILKPQLKQLIASYIDEKIAELTAEEPAV